MAPTQAADAAAAREPLLCPEEEEPASPRKVHPVPSPHAEHPELQFYDPAAVLGVSREVAFGYLILLTGGSVEYEPPAPEEGAASAPKNEPKQPQHKASLDDEASALAYAAITDGNVLHACFGLKASASGRASESNVIGAKASSSPFCCFPSAGALDALQLVLPQTTKNKLRMQNLVEILREVQDSHYEAMEAAVEGRAKNEGPDVYMDVIGAYTHCFTAIIRYHDAKKNIKCDKAKDKSKADSILTCCSNAVRQLKGMFSKPKINPQLEKVQQDALKDIERGFQGLMEEIWEGLENMATETSFTGFSGDD